MKIAFLFPGQGAQYVGMATGLCKDFTQANELFSLAGRILGYDLLDLCAKGPVEKLNSTRISQPAIYVSSLAALEAWRMQDPEGADNCAAAAGLSLGEYTALTYAGAIDFESGLKLVQERGEAMQVAAEAIPSGMLSVFGGEKAAVEEMCQEASAAGLIQIANLLCPGNIAVSGDLAGCEALDKLATAKGYKTVRLAVAGAFHTPIMNPALKSLKIKLQATEIQSPRLPVYSNVDSQPHASPESIREKLANQVVKPVLWEDTIRRLLDFGIEKFHEIGPGRVLAGLVKRVNRKIEIINHPA